ncbi:HAD family hydrolase [Paenibacillus sp. N4]|uniref:HAD family hydrolase n=1 Tax=Paenibacillus vietnamensis TaxID=2590547 RepID=UPI001CD04F13|nr:HAD family hydrolase [Paenibacillus vietnamensis]MCA0755948.1 HAD family hydrolase [Paenibacillus vietnamensis]
MIKLIVSDLDGTLLDHSRQIAGRDVDAVSMARSAGFEFCIASGRMYSEIRILMEPFGDRFHAVGQNGATVHTKDDRLLAASSFEPDVSSRLLQESRSCGHFVNFIHCTDDSFYLKERNDTTRPYEDRILKTCSVHSDLEAALREDELRCSKISYFGELEQLQQWKSELLDRFAGQIDSYISDKDCLDVMPLNVSKGTGLLRLIESLGLRPDEVACIGDSFNDLSMFALTRHSFAMSGSHPDVRSKAGSVVHSVADAIDRIMTYNHSLAG